MAQADLRAATLERLIAGAVVLARAQVGPAYKDFPSKQMIAAATHCVRDLVLLCGLPVPDDIELQPYNGFVALTYSRSVLLNMSGASDWDLVYIPKEGSEYARKSVELPAQVATVIAIIADSEEYSR